MRRFILDNKSFLCAVDAARRAFEFRGWGLVITEDGDDWVILNVVNGYWCTVIEKVGTARCDSGGYLIEIDDDLEDELRYLCMRDAGEVLEEGVKNYLNTMYKAFIQL